MLSTLEIQKILEVITEHTKPEEINQRFHDVLAALRYSALPKCNIDPSNYLSFEQISAQDISKLRVDPISNAPIATNPPPVENQAIITHTVILPKIEEPIKIIRIEPKPKNILPTKEKLLTEFQKRVVEKTLNILKPHGFTQEMLSAFVLQRAQNFIFSVEHTNTLIYLVQGCHPLPSPRVYPPLLKKECLSPKQALEETKDLNAAQLGALSRLFAFKLTAKLLRSFKSSVPFNQAHGTALKYLMRKGNAPLSAEKAMSRIQSLDLKAIRALIINLKTSTAKHIIHVSKRSAGSFKYT